MTGSLSLWPSGREARKLLAARGLDARVLAEATKLLADVHTMQVGEPEGLSAEQEAERDAAREAALWLWYLEWSAVARVAIRDQHQLRALGFRARGSAASASDEEQPEAPIAPPKGEPPPLG